MEKEIRCKCGKLLAKIRDGKIYIKCRGCCKEVALTTEPEKSR